MDYKRIFAVLAFLLSAGAYIPYGVYVFTGDAHPTISSWISWGIMDTAILAGMIAKRQVAWQMPAYVAGVTAIVGLHLWMGTSMGWTRIDSICVGLVVVAVGLWAMTKNPDVGIVISLVAITIGSWSMFQNSWYSPAREPILPWAMFVAGSIIGLPAIKKWNITGSWTPVWFLIIQSVVLILVCRQ